MRARDYVCMYDYHIAVSVKTLTRARLCVYVPVLCAMPGRVRVLVLLLCVSISTEFAYYGVKIL